MYATYSNICNYNDQLCHYDVSLVMNVLNLTFILPTYAARPLHFITLKWKLLNYTPSKNHQENIMESKTLTSLKKTRCI